MSWEHTHRDGTWHQHDDGVACDLDQPAKLRGGVTVVNADTGGGAATRGAFAITEPLSVEVTVGMTDHEKAVHDARVNLALSAQRAQQLRPVPPWSAEYKLRTALGRPALAKRVVDALPQPLAVELGDVLWIILEQRVAEELEAIKARVDHVVAERVAWYENQARQKREELTRERFDRTTRLS